MTWEWKIGDPVDDATGGSMDAQNWGRSSGDDIRNPIGFQDDPADEYSERAWDLYMDYQEIEALRYINMALDLNDCHHSYWNRKAIILEALKRYAESEECYNRSLALSRVNVVCDNKARMLYDWAVELREESKMDSDGSAKLHEAEAIALRAMRALPGDDSEEDLEKYLNLIDSIRFYIDYEKKYQKNLEIIKSHSKDVLFTIAGMRYYKSDARISPGLDLRLVREPDNKADSDAIAVYAGGEKIGYVANSMSTSFYLTSKASELKNTIDDETDAVYLLYLDRYLSIQYAIGKIIS